MSLVETDWLEKNLNKVVILDCSWHMPNTNRNGLKEYESKHIPKAIFFDLDKNSKKDSDLPHMLVNINNWNKIVSRMGIKREDRHDPKLVHVLNGGFEKWLNEKKKVTNIIENIKISNYKGFEKKELVKDKKNIDTNIQTKKFKLVDARSKERFEGKVAEPRKGLRSGSIKNSVCIPFNECLQKNRTFKSQNELKIIFESCLENINEKNIVFSCGSGVTACVLALAYSIINDKYQPCIYDGSWAEYGII